MSIMITLRSEIPEAPYYITCTDRFMSGWGPSKSKSNRCIFPCESAAEAWYVELYAQNRSEMKNIRICVVKPTLRNQVNTYSLFRREEARAWYPPIIGEGGEG